MQSTLPYLIILLLAGSHAVYGFWRMSAGRHLVAAQMDPIAFPGQKSPHLHTINGGNGFSINSTFEDLRKSTCTTNLVTDDKSAYWAPALQFHDPTNDSDTIVPNGGLLTYYLQRAEPGENVTAFPAGFQMLTGDMNKRKRNWPPNIRDDPKWNTMTFEEQQDALTEQSMTWTCIGVNGTNSNSYSSQQNGPSAFPSTNCKDGFRSEVFFPRCWNGNLDSPNHHSHVAYPDRHDSGTCPKSHPIHLVALFFEHTWDINKFSDMWPSDGKWPFRWGNDSTGWSYHGDFINGWEPELLQEAVDKCTDESGVIEKCQVFTSRNLLQNTTQQDACSIKDPFDTK